MTYIVSGSWPHLQFHIWVLSQKMGLKSNIFKKWLVSDLTCVPLLHQLP